MPTYFHHGTLIVAFIDPDLSTPGKIVIIAKAAEFIPQDDREYVSDMIVKNFEEDVLRPIGERALRASGLPPGVYKLADIELRLEIPIDAQS